METVSSDLVMLALERTQGHQFEKFVNDFYPSLVGARFVPLGGINDGGADGLDNEPIHEEIGFPTSFYQASIQEDHRRKIRKTVVRIREFGRDLKNLTYVTSRKIHLVDSEERDLTRELDVAITIRDASYISAHVNSTVGTRSAYHHNLSYLTNYLQSVGASNLVSPSDNVRSPAVYVFLEQELARRKGDTGLLDSVTDSLALWSLEGTDPEAGVLMSRDDALERVCVEIPAVRNVVASRFGRRMQHLASKGYPGGRRVRWYQRDDLFCLPYETRKSIEKENLADETLRREVLEGLVSRACELTSIELSGSEPAQAAAVALRSLQRAFENEGLAFASFLEGNNANQITIVDDLPKTLTELNVRPARRPDIGDAAIEVIRGVLYDSTELERSYLGKLSRTYTLLFTLNTEPRLVEYFQQVAGKLHLFVGADLLVRALSERYLSEGDQITRNTLLLASRLGARLILAQPVLDEVIGNLRAADHEFKNWFASIEHRITYEMARNAPKIMNRAYFYARLNGNLGDRSPRSWQAFVNQFVPHGDLHRPQGITQLRSYLLSTFGMEYLSTRELASQVGAEQLEELTQQLLEQKPTEQLARNDALMALSVYARRDRNREESKVAEFGYETWWLTQESRILQFTRSLVSAHHGARYMMRPDFLLNFMTLAPSPLEARQSLSRVFPSLLGIRLSRRMNEDDYHSIVEKVREAEEFEDGRRAAAISELTNQLKSSFHKQYDRSFADQRTQET